MAQNNFSPVFHPPQGDFLHEEEYTPKTFPPKAKDQKTSGRSTETVWRKTNIEEAKHKIRTRRKNEWHR